MKKLFTLGLALALASGAYADKLTILSCGEGTPGMDEPDLEGLSISPNGKYVCGSIGYGYGIFAADIDSGEVKYLLAENTDIGGELRHIDNNGLAIGFENSGVLFDFATGERIKLPTSQTVRNILGEAITNDGSMLVGSIVYADPEEKISITTGAYTYDRENWQILPTPSKEEMGLYYPRQKGSAAKYVSADGRVILGFMGSFGIPILWIKNDMGAYDYDFFPSRFVKITDEDFESDEKPLYAVSAMYMTLSNNGKYACMVASVQNKNGQAMNVPIVYNTETKELTIYNEIQEIDIKDKGLYPTAIADDGTIIGCVGAPYFGSTGSFIIEAGQTQAKLFRETFSNYAAKLATADELGYDVPTGISADGKRIVGYTFYSDDYYSEEDPAYYITYVIERGENDSVEEIGLGTTASAPEAFFGIDGQRREKLTPGLNIVRMKDGSTKKVLVK